MDSSDRDIEIGPGNGGYTGLEDGETQIASYGRQVNGGVFTGFSRFNATAEGEQGLNLNFGEDARGNVELVIDKSSGDDVSEEHMALLEKKFVKEKRKKLNSKKPPKPPRAPKGPSLDAADMKLIKELSELAMEKRMRIEQIKELKKMRAAKAQSSKSSNSTLVAMIITVLFCLIIFLQGINSRSSSSMGFQRSPEPVTSSGEGLIAIQLYQNLSPIEGNGPEPEHLNTMEQLYSSAPEEVAARGAG